MLPQFLEHGGEDGGEEDNKKDDFLKRPTTTEQHNSVGERQRLQITRIPPIGYYHIHERLILTKGCCAYQLFFSAPLTAKRSRYTLNCNHKIFCLYTV